MTLTACFVKIRVYLGLVFFVVVSAGFLYAHEESLFRKVLDQNQPAIKHVDQGWPDEDYREYLNRCMQYQYQLHEQKKRTAVFKILERSRWGSICGTSSICSDTTTWQDLNLFCGQKDLSIYLASIIDRTCTSFGRALLYTMLVNPTVSIDELTRRQEIVRYLVEHPDFLEKLDHQLNIIKESENMVISFWCDDPIRQEIKRDRYLQWPIPWINDFVNKSELCLSLLNSWGHIERFLYVRDYALASLFVTGYRALSLAHIPTPAKVQEIATWLEQERGINAGPMLVECLPRVEQFWGKIESPIAKNILGLMAGLYSLMNIKDSAIWMRDQLYLDTCLYIKIMHVSRFFKSLQILGSVVHDNQLFENKCVLSSFFKLVGPDQHVCNSDTRKLFSLLSHDSFSKEPSITAHKGRSLLCFKLMHEQQAVFENFFAAIAEIDVFVSLAKLYKEHESLVPRYCFVQYAQEQKPKLVIHDFWNQFVDHKKVVVNSLELGTPGSTGNIIITGPNAGGKSTVLKAIATAVLMAQTFGLAPAQQMILTPFSKISTHMNIKDDIAAGNSLFRAQVLRAQELLEFIQSAHSNSFCFIVIDEMFNGTSPREAEASAYSVAKNIAQHTNVMCLIATHYHLLTRLEKDTHVFSNYRVQVEQSDNGTILYPFKLKPGVSQQYLAFDILRAQGICGSVLDGAHALIEASPSPA